MGFIGSWRKFVRGAKNQAGVVDTAKVSQNVIAEAKRLNLNNLTNMFSTKYIKTVDNKALFGAMELSDFVKVSRLGDYSGSFKKALANTTLLDNVSVERSVRKVLSDAAATLPDAKLSKNVKNVSATKKALSIPDAKNVDELTAAVNANPTLKIKVDQLARKVNSNPRKALKMFGYSILFGGAAVTAVLILQKCIDEAAKASGCFYYYTENGEVKKCKVKQYSCKTPTASDVDMVCADDSLPSDIAQTKDCEGSSVECHANCDDDKHDLPENAALRCESKSPGDILAEGITNTIGPVIKGIGGVAGNIVKYLGIGLLLLAVVFVVFYFLRK